MNFDQTKYSIFNPKAKTVWDALDGNIKQTITNQLKKRHSYDVLYIKIIKKKNIFFTYKINLFILMNTLLIFFR